MKVIFALILISLISCNNNRGLRLSATNSCNPDRDLASYELNEGEEQTFEVSTQNFTGGESFSTPTFRFSKYINDQVFTYSTVSLPAGALNLQNLCVGGFVFNGPSQSGSGSFEVAFLNSSGGVQIAGGQIDYDTGKPEDETVLILSDLLNEPVSPVTPDILTQLSLLGFETQVFTYINGPRRNNEFLIHARNLSEGLFTRIGVNLVNEEN